LVGALVGAFDGVLVGAFDGVLVGALEEEEEEQSPLS